MTDVRIIKPWSQPDLFRQTPGGSGVWEGCRFTFEPVDRCDYLVVLNHPPEAVSVEVPPGNVWCLIQEPPISAYRWLKDGFSHYDCVYTPDPRQRGAKIIRSHGAPPWQVDRSYDELCAQPLPTKSRDLSWVTSNQTIFPGHRKRLRFLDRLRDSQVPFDLFGQGFNPLPDKWDGLASYRYSLAIENHSTPHYWTEKNADCFLAGTMPIYFGAENIADYFPAESFVWVDIADPRTPELVAEITRSDRAERHRDAVLEARRRVLEEHQFFPFIARQIAEARRTHEELPRRAVSLPQIPDRTHYCLTHPRAKQLLLSAGRHLTLR